MNPTHSTLSIPFSWGWKLLLVVGGAVLLLAILFFLSYKKIYAKALFLVFGVVIWFLFLKSGIHPTIAGILLNGDAVRSKSMHSDFVCIPPLASPSCPP